MGVVCVESGTEPPPALEGAGSFARRVGGSAGWLAVLALTSSLALVGGAGCSAGGELESDCGYAWRSEHDLKIATWWQTDVSGQCGPGTQGEGCAAQALTNGYADCNHGATARFQVQDDWKETTGELQNARSNQSDGVLEKTFDGGIINGGANVRKLAGCDGGGPPGIAHLGTLDAPVERFLAERLPRDLVHLVTCPGSREVFGVVVGLHSLNQLYSNQEVAAQVEAAGWDLSSIGLEQFRLLLDKVANLDPAYARPLVLDAEAGTLSRFVIENVMVALAQRDPFGYDGYVEFWSRLSGTAPSSNPVVNLRLFREALEFVASIGFYIQVPPKSELALEVVARGGGVFTVNGDWAAPAYPQLRTTRFPGTQAVYVYTSDVAVAVGRAGAPSLERGDPMLGWFKTITSADVQSTFSYQKHALSPVTSTDGETQAKSADELFNLEGVSLRGVPGLPAYVPYFTFDDLEKKVAKYVTCLAEKSEYSTRPPPLADLDAAKVAADARTDELVEACSGEFGELLTYVHDQYCEVISGSPDGCVEAPAREPVRLH